MCDPVMTVLPPIRNIRVGAVEIKLSAGPGRLERGELYVLPFEAHLEGMFVINLREVIGELEGGRNFIRRQEGITPKSLQAVETESWKAAVFGPLRYPQNPIFCRKIAQIGRCRRDARGVKIIQTGAGNVNQLRRKRVGVNQGALLRIGGLVALLEATAIGHAAKNTGNELRIIRKAESEEHLVFFIEIRV